MLLDDNFATIVLAVACGALGAVALDLRDTTGALLVPLTAAQILWINVLTDGLPALALAFDLTPDVMQQPPRQSDAALLDRASRRFVIGAGPIKAILAIALFGVVPDGTFFAHDS